MTVSSATYKADTTGNGVTTEFSIPFELQDENQVLVTQVSTTGVETVLVLNTDYTVSDIGTANRKITLTDPLPTGERVIRTPNISLTQTVDYVEGDDFPAETHEDALDKLTLICQQFQEQLDRAVKLNVSDAIDIDALITDIQDVADNLAALNSVAGIVADVSTVAGIESAVSTLSAIASDVTVAAAISTGITDVSAIDSDVTAVAGLSAAIGTLSAIASDITTASGISSDISTVAGISADVSTVAGLETEILAVPGQAQAAADSAAAAATFDPALYLAKASADMAGNAITNLLSLNGGPLASFRNKVTNGNFDIWQRAASQTLSGYGSADRWSNIHTGSTKTVTREDFAVGQTDVPGNPKHFMRTVVASVAGAGNYAIAIHKMADLRQFAGKTVTVTFYGKADAARNIANEFYKFFGTGGSPSSPVTSIGSTTHSFTTSWQKFSFTVDIPSDVSKIYGTNGDHHLELLFWFDAGSNFDGRTNTLGQQSGTFDIARVSVVEGDATQEADPFSPRSDIEEMALCNRHCLKIYPDDDTGGTYYSPIGDGRWTSTSTAWVRIDLPVEMHGALTLVVEGGASSYLINTGGGAGGVAVGPADMIIVRYHRTAAMIQIAKSGTGSTTGQGTTLYTNNQNTDSLLITSEI